MKEIYSKCTASISEVKKNPSALIEASDGEAIAILNHNHPTAYLVPAETYEDLINRLEDYELALMVKERQKEKKSAITVSLDDL